MVFRDLCILCKRCLVAFVAAVLCVVPFSGGATDVMVKLYRLKFVDKDQAGYFRTKYTQDLYDSAIVTNVSFYGDCYNFNHTWSVEAVLLENRWYIYFETGGNCDKVTLTMLFFGNVEGDGGWEIDRLTGHSMKELP